MNDNFALELGDYCLSLVSSPSFQTLCAAFEQQQVEEMLAEKPGDADQRDRISRIQGFRSFLTLVGLTVERKRVLMAQETNKPEIADHSDDPSVHDIFDYQYEPESSID